MPLPPNQLVVVTGDPRSGTSLNFCVTRELWD